MTPHPDYRCPGCNQPIEPLAAIRTYHGQCDPWGRMEMLEKALDRVREITPEVQDDLRNGFPVSAKRHLDEIAEVASAALDCRPVQMKGRCKADAERMEMLEKVMHTVVVAYDKDQGARYDDFATCADLKNAIEAARAALARPVQMKGME